MSIQSNVNQGLSIAGLLYQHSARGEAYQEEVRAKRAAKRKTQAGRGRLPEDNVSAEEVRSVIEVHGAENFPHREQMEQLAERLEIAERVPSPRTRAAAQQAESRFSQSVVAGHEEEVAESWVQQNTPPSSGLSREYVKRFAKAHGYTYDAARKALSKAYIKKLTASARYKRAQQRVRERQQGGPK